MSELDRALDALQKADAEGNTADAAQIAAYVKDLQAQQATEEQQNQWYLEGREKPGTLRNPVAAGALGLVAGPVAGKIADVALAKRLNAPSAISAPSPTEFSPGQKWAAKTGFGAGTGETVQAVDAAYKKEQGPLGKGKISSKVLKGSPLGIDPAMQAIAKKEAEAARFAAIRQAEAEAAKRAGSVAGRFGEAATKALPLAGRALAGAGAGVELSDAYNRYKSGDYTGAVIGGIGGLGSAAALIPHPVTRYGGAALGAGAGLINMYRDYNKKQSAAQPMLEPEPEQPFPGMAHGGLVHLAEGGEPEFGEARAYEPSYSEKIRDLAAKHIGRERANRLLAGPNARVEDNFNPVALAAQTPGAIADAATGFVKAGKEGDYLGGMGHYLVGGLNVAPMVKPAGQLVKKMIPKMAGGKSVVAEGAVDVAKKVKGFLEHTPKKPNPLVGTRYKTTDLGGLIEPTPFDIEKAIGAKVMHRPYDLSSRNQLVEEVSGHKLLNPFKTEGGQPFGRDEILQATGQGGASNKIINNRILKRVDVGAKEGNGQVFNIPSTMGYGSEAFSNMPIDILLDLIKQRELPKETLQYLSNLVRAKSPALQNFVGFEDPRVAEQFLKGGFGLTTTPGKLRVGATNVLTGKQNKAQELLDYNQEDLFGAIRAPELRNVPPGYMGETIMEAVPGHPGFKTGSHSAYDSGDASIYRGQGVNAPISVWMPDEYKKALAGVRADPKTASKALGHQRAMARNVLGTAESGVAQTVTPQVADNLQRYQEAVKAGSLDPNNLDAIHKYIYGNKAEGYAPGGKVLSAVKKMSEEAQAAYKAKFTPGFYHGSPSNSIEAFDPSKGDRAFPTEGVTFATRSPKFADSFLGMNRKGEYEKGSTTYPINVNLGKQFVPGSPEGAALIDQYIAKMPANPDAVMSPAKRAKALKSGAWDVMEDPNFLQHLKDTGHDTFTVMEGGVPNVGVFNPSNIRGKFAKFNPEDAADPDFMKAEGGPVQHFSGGNRVLSGGLEMLQKMIKAEGRTPVVPVPNRWFSQPEKFPNVQGMVNKTLENSQLPREAFHSGAFIDPRTGQILDRNIYNDVGVLIDPNTGRPMMSAGKESGIEMLDPKTGSYTKSNLVRQSLFKPTGGDPMLGEMPFIATIEKGGMGHKYGLGTEYATPTEMYNTMTGANPTLRPRSRGDVFGMGDVVGQVQVGGRGMPHDVYEKLFVAPKGSDVPGVKLSKKTGGRVKKK
jgi:hypothetical protein